ncbi:polysaccharide export protein [Pseudovibrio japonicus]|uniref:Polysaccharide export protein n=1 Tax=Pseudovibrio japonicus TaxID=366534 RepID=A0ABQ3ETC3_9HYPH|nr:polysaccharide export protein [Pseudovibrio japonicus]
MAPGPQAPVASVSTESSAAVSQPTAYKLGSGDKLRVIVYGEDELSGEFVIDDQGNLNMPLIGKVSAQDKSLSEVEESVVANLRNGYLRDPKVSLEVLNYRPFFIQGEIKEPGEYPYKTGLTLQDAVAIAGGYSYRANDKAVYIRKVGTDREVSVALTGTRVHIQPGDSIRIPERFF